MIKKFIYKIKNKLFLWSSEASKLKKPLLKEMVKYDSFAKSKNNKFALSFGAGRSGQNWYSKIFNSHTNWIGTCERFADYEAFYRFTSYYGLPINNQNFYELIRLSSNMDMAKYQNSFISSPYFGFGVKELSKKLKPDYIFFNIRNPIQSIESFYQKGWYSYLYHFKAEVPALDISDNLYRSFSRIIPKTEFLEQWLKFTRIGKLTWFWATINKAIFDDFNRIKNIEKIFVKLEDVSQNYESYERLAYKFKFEKKLSKINFYNVLNKASNTEFKHEYDYKNWSKIEKKEFENIIEEIFPNYNVIKTNI
jgi:hypothetical protein